MQIKKWKEINQKEKGIILFTVLSILLIIGVFFYQSFALFQVNQKQNLIQGNVEELGDLYFAYYLDGKIQEDFPTRTKNPNIIFDYENSYCGVLGMKDNTIVLSFDALNWEVKVKNLKKSSTKCRLAFKTSETLIQKLQDIPKVETDSGLYRITHGGEKDTIWYTPEYRYAGSEPDNYLLFNGELWRIVGLVNVLENEENTVQRIKIVRNDGIGWYSWDTSDTTLSEGHGVNEWSQADIMKLLNDGYEREKVGGSLYWNRTSGNCYVNNSNAIDVCDFTKKGLQKEAQDMIETVIWNVGSNGTLKGNNAVTTFYHFERGDDSGLGCSSGAWCDLTTERTTKWKGEVGLLYPSDYIWATSGGDGMDRVTCITGPASDWNQENFQPCIQNDWLYDSKLFKYFITPFANTTSSSTIFGVANTGEVRYFYVETQTLIFPTLYLKDELFYVSGDGTESSPYQISF